MAKRKKTRQQKIIADLRRQIYASNTESRSFEKVPEKTPQSISLSENLAVEKKTYSSTLVNVNYLIKDLQKTAILTALIISAQLLLVFILKNHLLVLSGLIY